MEKKALLSALWIFLVVNFMFCDIFTLMHSEDLKNLLNGKVGEMYVTQKFLLIFAIFMEIPMVMILLSRILPFKLNRVINIIAAVLLAIIQSWSLTVGEITLHYWFFSMVEIATCIGIFVVAWNWPASETENGSI